MARPTKYRADFPDRALGIMRNGASLHEVASDLGISFETLNVWRKDGKHKTFAKAIDQGSTLAQVWWIKLGRAGAAGKVPNFQAAPWIFCMKNMFGWRNEDRTEIVGKDGGAIQISWPLPRTQLDE